MSACDMYAFELPLSDMANNRVGSWQDTLHRALQWRALEHLLAGTAETLDGSEGWLLEKRTRNAEVIMFVARSSGSLIGFAKVTQPSGMIIADCAIHTLSGRAWAQAPAKPMLNRDGQHMSGKDGKRIWVPIIAFVTKDLRDRWSDAVIAALRASHPEALP